MFFVNVASKGLRCCASSLFATHRRELRSVSGIEAMRGGKSENLEKRGCGEKVAESQKPHA
jgi:hypothetical protein